MAKTWTAEELSKEIEMLDFCESKHYAAVFRQAAKYDALRVAAERFLAADDRGEQVEWCQSLAALRAAVEEK